MELSKDEASKAKTDNAAAGGQQGEDTMDYDIPGGNGIGSHQQT